MCHILNTPLTTFENVGSVVILTAIAFVFRLTFGYHHIISALDSVGFSGVDWKYSGLCDTKVRLPAVLKYQRR